MTDRTDEKKTALDLARIRVDGFFGPCGSTYRYRLARMTDPNETDVTPEERIDALAIQVAELTAVVARSEVARLEGERD